MRLADPTGCWNRGQVNVRRVTPIVRAGLNRDGGSPPPVIHLSVWRAVARFLVGWSSGGWMAGHRLPPLALLFCDFDDFKLINDTGGHA